jgi:hypothetical protein
MSLKTLPLVRHLRYLYYIMFAEFAYRQLGSHYFNSTSIDYEFLNDVWNGRA